MRSFIKFILPTRARRRARRRVRRQRQRRAVERATSPSSARRTSRKAAYDALLARRSRASAQASLPEAGHGGVRGAQEQGRDRARAAGRAHRRRELDGIKITDKQVEARLTTIKKQYFGGSETKYQAQLKQQHLTDAQVRDDIRSQLIYEALVTKITKGVKVTDSDVHDYYLAHPQLYSKPQTRDVRHILVKNEAARRLDLRPAEGRQRARRGARSRRSTRRIRARRTTAAS